MNEQPSSENCYRTYGIVTMPIDNEKTLIYSPLSETSALLTTAELQLLLSCQTFETLQTHIESYFQKLYHKQLDNKKGLLANFFRSIIKNTIQEEGELPIQKEKIELIRSKLQEWRDERFLVSQQELQKKIMKAIPNFERLPEGRIKILGIPTRNRPSLLARGLQTYLENMYHHERECTIHIIDDSDKDSIAVSNGQAIDELFKNSETEYLFINRNYRHKLIETIANKSDVSKKIVRFALMGDSRCSIRTGASRNILLLLATGEPSVQVDDDTLCNILHYPHNEDGISLSSEAECNKYWFYESFKQSQGAMKLKDIDFLSIHEMLLGKHPGSLIWQHKRLKIDHFGRSLLEKIEQPKTTIAFSMTGALGDCGMTRHWPRLVSEDKSYQKLIRNKSLYRNHLCSRQLFRGVPQLTLSDGLFCIAMNIGLNTAEFLPPFMPVQRNSDGIFGRLIYSCFKNTCRAYSPYAIIHDPLNRPSKINISQALSVGPLRCPDILEAILLRPASMWPFGADPYHNLEMVGNYLFDLSHYPTRDFKYIIGNHCRQLARSRINHLQQFLSKRSNAPNYWKSDVRQVIRNFRELMFREDICVPCDLPGSFEERLILFQELVGKFGQLLIHWPVIWEAAEDLRKLEKFKAIEN